MGSIQVELTALAVLLLTAGFSFAWAWVKTKFKPQQLAVVYDLARTAVHAAEQFGEDHKITGTAQLRMAKDALEAGAKRVGIKLTDAEIVSFIHASLAELRAVQAQQVPAAA